MYDIKKIKINRDAMKMDINVYIDEAIDAPDLNVYLDKLEEVFRKDWDKTVPVPIDKKEKKQAFPIKAFRQFKNDLTNKARFKKQFNVDDYVDDYKMKEASGEDKKYITNLRNQILDEDFSLKDAGNFIRQLKNKSKEEAESVSPVQSAINRSFTINGEPMVISDLEYAKDAIPSYDKKNYATQLNRLKQLLPYEKRKLIPDGSIQILIDKFEAEGENIEESTPFAPDINLKGFFNESGLFSGIDADEREEIYEYWEGIFDKHKEFKETMDDLVNDNESLRSSWEKIKEKSYIIPISGKVTHLPDIFDSVNLFIRDYLILLGVLEKPTGEGVSGYTKTTTSDTGRDTHTDIAEGDIKNIKDDIDYILEDFGEADITEVDPILLANYMSNKQPILFKEGDLDSALRHIKRRGRKLTLSKEMIGVMEKYFDNLKKEIRVIKKDEDNLFYLPINTQTHDKNDVFEINEAYSEFLEKVAELLLPKSTYGTSGAYTGTGRDESPFTTTQTPTSAKISSGVGLDLEGPLPEMTGKVLGIIGEYIIKPINSGKYFGGEPDFTTKAWYTTMNTYTKTDPYSKTLSNMLDSFNPTPAELDRITKMINLMVRRTDVTVSNPGVYIQSGINALNEVLGDNKQNKELGGHIWYLINNDASIGKTPVKSLHEDYVANSKGKVFQMLKRLLNSYEFRRKLLIRDISGKHEKRATAPNTLPTIDLKPGMVHKDNVDLLKSAIRLLSILEDESKTILSSFDLIMDAHDIIRKMSNRNIVYAYLSLDDIDNVDYILKQVPTYELNILDLQQIVTDLDSFSNIAKAFGINEDAVYTIKGLCRGIY